MKFIDELAQSISPHAHKLNQTIAMSAVMLHTKLDKIEQAVSDMGGPDVGDKWLRINFKKKIKSEEWIEVTLFGETPAEVPMNEAWLVQSITVDGQQEKSPAFVLAWDQISLFASIGKEGFGTETYNGRVVGQPGETLFIRARAEGTVSITVHLIRRRNPTVATERIEAGAKPPLQGRNTHEVARDLIAHVEPDIYQEPSQETTTPEIIPGIPMPSIPIGPGGVVGGNGSR